MKGYYLYLTHDLPGIVEERIEASESVMIPDDGGLSKFIRGTNTRDVCIVGFI